MTKTKTKTCRSLVFILQKYNKFVNKQKSFPLRGLGKIYYPMARGQ